MVRKFRGIHVSYEPSDPSVGIMGETFCAWPLYADANKDGPWCKLVDVATGEVRWEDSATGKFTTSPGYEGALTESALRHFAEDFYKMQGDGHGDDNE